MQAWQTVLRLRQTEEFNCNWERDHLCDIWAMILFYSAHPKNVSDAKLKSNGIISLVKAILRQNNIEPVVWLLLVTVEKNSTEKKKTISSTLPCFLCQFLLQLCPS